MEKGSGGRYEDDEHHRRNGFGQTTVEAAHIPSNPTIGNTWTLNDDDDDDEAAHWEATIECYTICLSKLLKLAYKERCNFILDQVRLTSTPPWSS